MTLLFKHTLKGMDVVHVLPKAEIAFKLLFTEKFFIVVMVVVECSAEQTQSGAGSAICGDESHIRLGSTEHSLRLSNARLKDKYPRRAPEGLS
ncbi:hypothetical protein R1flu_009331 [Riccia fluitans]|uniref:Uncharacterized protein n=1 Tax=Riccia fluitans TaxID=41844 RepID=A0ABD1Z1S2_9MARC